MKIIFLDMDGVLCVPRYNVAVNRIHERDVIDPAGVGFLNRLLEVDPTIKFVISSTWRKVYTSEELLAHLQAAGFTGEFHNDWKTGRHPKGHRGLEIQEWLEHHPEITEYIIIDDEVSDIYPYVNKKYVVHTGMYDGISLQNFHDMNTKLFGNKTAWLEHHWNERKSQGKSVASIPL